MKVTLITKSSPTDILAGSVKVGCPSCSKMNLVKIHYDRPSIKACWYCDSVFQVGEEKQPRLSVDEVTPEAKEEIADLIDKTVPMHCSMCGAKVEFNSFALAEWIAEIIECF